MMLAVYVRYGLLTVSLKARRSFCVLRLQMSPVYINVQFFRKYLWK